MRARVSAPRRAASAGVTSAPANNIAPKGTVSTIMVRDTVVGNAAAVINAR
jgi:hypothetical protein